MVDFYQTTSGMLPPSSPVAACRQFLHSDIKSFTNNFSDDLIIGSGSFGHVYKATIPITPEKTISAAVKRRSFNSKQGSIEFWTEVNLLSQSRHTCLISLIGYCFDDYANEMILVYEYMINGTLADHIYKSSVNSPCLSWEQRVKICIGVGRGLEYLHTGTKFNQIVVHRDLKSSNILLDADWAAKISDFGLCKIFTGEERNYNPVIASVKGTLGYMDPNYCKTQKLSTKTDVYAFGVVLLEVLCGRRSMDPKAVDLQKKLVMWAQLCIREGVVHRIIDPGLRGKIADEGLSIFLDIAVKCLQDRPDKRPSMVEVVTKLEAVLASQYTTYSSSVDDEFVKIFFGTVSSSSSSTYSEADPLRLAVESGSDRSDTVNQYPGSKTESNIDNDIRRFIKPKSSSEINAFDVPADLQSNPVKGGISIPSTIAETSETSISLSPDKYNEYEKLVRRMNPPRVVGDNESCENATVIKVDGTNAHGVLLEVVQVFTDFSLIVTKASRTSDGAWVMDVFNVIDEEGNKVTDNKKLRNLQKTLCSIFILSAGSNRKGEISIPEDHTRIELIGNDRPGLLSEVCAVLTDLQCNVVSAELWTHNTRLAAVMHITANEIESAIIEPDKLSRIKKTLLIVLEGGRDNTEARITVSHGCARFDRRLHEMMFADNRDYKRGRTLNDKKLGPKVDVVNWHDKGYSQVAIQCKNKPKLLFDTICALTDCLYFVSHGNFNAEGPEAYMEFWIRHIDGTPFYSDEETQRVVQCLEAAIERRVSEGLKIELRTKDRVGLLSDVTRIIRENSLTINRAEVTTAGDKAVFAFYLDDTLGYPLDPKIVDNVKKEIGQNILQVGLPYQTSVNCHQVQH